ncbi:MAG: M16 family metallopeptidase [Myxococcales bacterium]
MPRLDVPEGLLRPIEAELGNGLRIRMLPDPSVETISYQTFFRVGSRNERPGLTGISHLFEHLMFNGARRYGPKEFDRLIESRGGRSNAYTSWDVTAYHEEAPADALELLIDLEVDRVGALALTEESLASEREVVREERRQSVDDSVLGALDEQLQALVFLAHPYRWPIIGWPADLGRIGLADCRDFFARYYAPNNASLYLCGRFDPDRAFRAIEAAYGALPRGPEVPAPPREEPPQKGARGARVLHPVHAPEVGIAFLAPAAHEEASADLDALQAVLGFGDGSVLGRSLIHERRLCTEVDVDYAWRLDPGPLVVWMELPPRGDPKRAAAALWRELDRIQEKGPEPARLERAKSQMEVALLRELSSCAGRAHAVGSGEWLLGGLEAVSGMFDRIRRVTPRSAREVARRVFRREAACVVTAQP